MMAERGAALAAWTDGIRAARVTQALQTATTVHGFAASEADAETALAVTGNYAGTLPNSLGTLTPSFSTPAASSEHYAQLTSGGGIGPEGGPVFAPPIP